MVNKIGWTPLTIAEGSLLPGHFQDRRLRPQALLLKLGAKKREVPDEVRYAGLDKDGRETTVGGGGDGAPTAKPKSGCDQTVRGKELSSVRQLDMFG